jgi:glycosyltransferase involved in cell wall biosynthesis
VCSSDLALQSFTDMGVAADKLHRIPYGVDISAFRATTVRDDEFRVLFVGALGVRKGLHDLLQGFAQAELPNARLVLAGPAEPEADRLLARFPVAALERTGPLPRAAVAEQMSRASVLVLPSVEEGLALVMAQALACALPVIATRNTGAEDLFADGDEGFIIDIRDPEAIAERLTRLAGDRALLDAMSDAARRRLEALGGWAAYGDASLALFRRLADERA